MKKTHTDLSVLGHIKLRGNRSSFTYKIRESISNTRYLHSQGVESIVKQISNKNAHRQVADKAGVLAPKLYNRPVPKEYLKAPRQSKFVIKPISGTNSAGVLLIRKTEGGFKNIKTKEHYANWGDVLSLYPPNSTPLQIEQLINSDDYKLYCFYGETPLVLQKRTIGNRRRFRWYNSEWEPVHTGKYRVSPNLKRPSVAGRTALIDAARRVSLAIPLPFVRVDLYLTSTDEVRLGEVTPHPGGYFQFNEEWDQRLGQHYEKAAARLGNDLLNRQIDPRFLKNRPFGSMVRDILNRSASIFRYTPPQNPHIVK